MLDWKALYPADYQAMLCVVLISFLVLLTNTIRSVSQYTTLPENVRIFQREEEVRAQLFLQGEGAGSAEGAREGAGEGAGSTIRNTTAL